MKRCTKCGYTKDADKFSRNRSTKDGLDSWCRECRRTRCAAKPKSPELPAGMKRCSKCKEVKLVSEFAKSHNMKDGLQSWCNDCTVEWRERNRDAVAEQRRQHYKANRKELLEYKRQWRERNRDGVLALYGGVCTECGSTDRLEVDHINGDGAQERMALYRDPRSISSFYRHLFNLRYRRADLQLLCKFHHTQKTAAERRQKKVNNNGNVLV